MVRLPPSQPRNRVCRPVAFTLIELLAAATSLTLLVALIEPSLLASREASKLSVCLDRLRTIGGASAVYASADLGGFLIPIHAAQFAQNPIDSIFIGAYEWGGKSGIGDPDFIPDFAGSLLGSRYGTVAGFGPATRPLNTYLYTHGFRDNKDPLHDRIGVVADTRLQLDVFRCPADDGPPGGAHCPDWINNPGRSSFDHFGNSYAANTFMIWSAGGPLGPGFESGEMGSNSPYLRPASRIPAPSRVINYEENIGRWAWACRRERCDGSLNGLDLSPGVDPGPTKALRGWHDKDWTYLRGFADGHAERQRVYIEGTEDADGYAYHYRSELVFPDDPQRQSSSACVIVRGPGWQKDTLPAPYMRTGLIHSRVGRPAYETCVTNP